MEEILASPRNGGYGLARGYRNPGDPFPKTRRVVVSMNVNQQGYKIFKPVRPLGWVLVEMTPAP
jgi:hypothetical protein